MRGKGVGAAHFAGYHGITPAYAGKSLRGSFLPRLQWDHPRVCGEKIEEAKYYIEAKGSPPRMRGKVVGTGLTLKATGITPAYAGKSLLLPAWMLHQGDHPRVCGEKTKKIP